MSVQRLEADLKVGAFGLTIDGPTRRLDFPRGEIDDLRGRAGETEYGAREVVLDKLHFRIDRNLWQAEAGSAGGVFLRGEDDAFVLAIDRIEMPHGVAIHRAAEGGVEIIAPHASLLDVSHSKLLMWDGRRDGFFNQVFGVFESPVEGNTSRLFVAYQAFELHRAEYESIFGAMPDFSDRSRFPELTAEQTGCERLDSDSKCVGVQRGAPGDGAEYDGLAADDQKAVTEVVAKAVQHR
jgi:hypothetical protein